MKICNLLFLIVYCASPLFSTSDRPKLFIDCNTRCDMVFIKQEMTFVNYVQDRQAADVFVLATDQRASAGTREIQFIITGQKRFEGQIDTIQFYREANVSDSEAREQFLKYLKKAMLPYAMQTSLVDLIEYSIPIKDEDQIVENKEERDPWNNWSFSLRANAFLNGESSFQQSELSGSIGGTRITEQSKIRFFTFYNYETSSFTLSDGEEVSTTINRNRNALLYVKSINDHLSVGGEIEAGSSTFGNTDFEAAFKSAIEYNIYPYSDNSTRRFSIRYSIGPEYFNYTEKTIFDRETETRLRQGIDIEFNQTQKWGNISIFASTEQFLHNLNQYNVELNPDVELNLLKGLSLNFGGFISFVNDRINIAQTEFSDEDILLQAIQLDTNYTYATYLGFNYRFGTQNNSVVNPRF